MILGDKEKNKEQVGSCLVYVTPSRVRHIMLVNLTIMLFSFTLKIVPLCRKLYARVMLAEISPLNPWYHPNESPKPKKQHFNIFVLLWTWHTLLL